VARVRVRHEGPFVGAVQVMMRSPVGGVARDMYRRGQNVRSRALVLAGVETGRLRASIHVELVQQGGSIAARVGSNVAYAMWHHEGHGPIRPVRAQVLVFNARGRWVFARYVRPVPGTEYLRKALPAARGQLAARAASLVELSLRLDVLQKHVDGELAQQEPLADLLVAQPHLVQGEDRALLVRQPDEEGRVRRFTHGLLLPEDRKIEGAGPAPERTAPASGESTYVGSFFGASR
jgi:hypothetical protein